MNAIGGLVAAARGLEPSHDECVNAYWYGYPGGSWAGAGLKQRLVEMFPDEGPEYAVAYDVVYGALPDCVCWRCVPCLTDPCEICRFEYEYREDGLIA